MLKLRCGCYPRTWPREHRAAGIIVKKSDSWHSSPDTADPGSRPHASRQAHCNGNRDLEVILRDLAEFYAHDAGFLLKIIDPFRRKHQDKSLCSRRKTQLFSKNPFTIPFIISSAKPMTFFWSALVKCRRKSLKSVIKINQHQRWPGDTAPGSGRIARPPPPRPCHR